jgi:hypothetical protein
MVSVDNKNISGRQNASVDNQNISGRQNGVCRQSKYHRETKSGIYKQQRKSTFAIPTSPIVMDETMEGPEFVLPLRHQLPVPPKVNVCGRIKMHLSAHRNKKDIL